MNYLKGYGDENAKMYNENVFEPYLRNKLIDTSKGGFVRPEFISTDFITAQNVADLLTKKFQTNAVVKKSDTYLKDMIQVVINVINKVANPTQTLTTLSKSPANSKIITEFSNITNSLDDSQINDIKKENEDLNNYEAWVNNNY
jgi:hypothetical protein